LLRNELIISAIVSGIIFIVIGMYFRKYDPDSWVWGRAWIAVPEWIVYSSLGACFIIIAMISILFVT